MTAFWIITWTFIIGGLAAFFWPHDPNKMGIDNMGKAIAGAMACAIGLTMAAFGWLVL